LFLSVEVFRNWVFFVFVLVVDAILEASVEHGGADYRVMSIIGLLRR
jgi:hypothetical protein